jgi:hypothetical protein
MNSHTEMTAATAETARIVGGVSTSQLADPTPCTDRALAVSGRDPALAKS